MLTIIASCLCIYSIAWLFLKLREKIAAANFKWAEEAMLITGGTFISFLSRHPNSRTSNPLWVFRLPRNR